jgi:hypothetical protein
VKFPVALSGGNKEKFETACRRDAIDAATDIRIWKSIDLDPHRLLDERK